MYLVLLFVVFCLWYSAYYYKWKKNIYDHASKIPGPFRLPLIGTLYLFIGIRREDVFSVLHSLLKKYGSFFRTWNRSQLEVHISKPEHVEVILGSSIHITKGTQYEPMRFMMGRGLATSTGWRWYQDRRRFTPAFSFKLLKSFLPVFIRNTESLLDTLDTKAGGDAFDIEKPVKLSCLSTICESAMGTRMEDIRQANPKIVVIYERLEEIAFWKMIHPFVPYFIVFNVLPKGRRIRQMLFETTQFVRNIIHTRRSFLEEKLPHQHEHTSGDGTQTFTEKQHLCILDLLLQNTEDDERLSEDFIIDQVQTFIIGGFTTIAIAVSWALFLIGHHPGVQEKVFAEIRDVLGDKLTPTSFDDLHKLKYLERVIKETMRIYTPIPIITRYLEEDCYIDGKKIPAGTDVYIHIHSLHKSSDCFRNPDKFDPDRFLAENSVGRHPYSYIPFSAGLRNCIGLKFAMYETQVILAAIINKYEVKSVQSLDSIRFFPEIVLKTVDGIFLKLQKRNIEKALE